MATINESTELTEQKPQSTHERPKSEFDPCRNASVVSPFYLYRHDSPRPSFDVNNKFDEDPVHVSVKDLECGMNSLSPSISQEKRDAQQKPRGRNRLMFWKKQKPCMLQPKQRGCAWFAGLSHKQKIMVKILIGLLIVGAAVGIAVGISIHVGGGVYKNNNSSSQIG